MLVIPARSLEPHHIDSKFVFVTVTVTVTVYDYMIIDFDIKICSHGYGFEINEQKKRLDT